MTTPTFRLLLLLALWGWVVACASAQQPAAPSPGASEAPSFPPALTEVDTRTPVAERVTIDPQTTLVPLTDPVLEVLDPDKSFSLGLDRAARDRFQFLDHRRVLVATTRLALDSEGRHLLETLLPERRPIVRRVVLFRDEHNAPARTAAIDRVLAAWPEVRVFERNAAGPRLTPGMIEDVDVVLIDVPMRGSSSAPEMIFVQGLLQDAALRQLAVVVLDRPIPFSGHVYDGPVADLARRPYPLPEVLGLTTGETVNLLNAHFGLGLQVQVIPMSAYRRSMGTAPLLDAWRLRQVDPLRTLDSNPRMAEWETYHDSDSLRAALRLVAGLLPEGRAREVRPASGNAPAAMVLDPAPVAPAAFATSIGRYLTEGLRARADGPNVPEGSVLIEANAAPERPVYLALAVWHVLAQADPALLPERGEAGPLGSPALVEALHARRDPREVQRLWADRPEYRDIELRRNQNLLYP